MRRCIACQRFLQLLRINRHLLKSSLPAKPDSSGGSLPDRRKERVQQLFFDIQDVAAGRLKLLKAVEGKWPKESDRCASLSGCRHSAFSLSGLADSDEAGKAEALLLHRRLLPGALRPNRANSWSLPTRTR